jgi:uncharacterized SAM-binding protein YcdF (DUF218 family)
MVSGSYGMGTAGAWKPFDSRGPEAGWHEGSAQYQNKEARIIPPIVAPSVLEESVSDWFEEDDSVPFMMQVFQIRPERRAVIPAVTHVDGSGRLQTVSADANPRFHLLISAFRDLTQVPMILNTSFNENERVVCRPEEALDCFLRTKMDMLVLGETVVERVNIWGEHLPFDCRRTFIVVQAVLSVVLVCALGGGIWVYRDTLLQGAADLWVVSDKITHADAVVVLGGGYDVRPVVAAKLYRDGIVPKVLLSRATEIVVNEKQATAEQIDVRVLLQLGVPHNAIEFFGQGSTSTHDEALTLKEWATRHQVSRLIVPAEVFFARRARWVLRQAFLKTNIRVEVPSFDPPLAYSRLEWWKSGGWRTFPIEIIKYLYYRVRY